MLTWMPVAPSSAPQLVSAVGRAGSTWPAHSKPEGDQLAKTAVWGRQIIIASRKAIDAETPRWSFIGFWKALAATGTRLDTVPRACERHDQEAPYVRRAVGRSYHPINARQVRIVVAGCWFRRSRRFA